MKSRAAFVVSLILATGAVRGAQEMSLLSVESGMPARTIATPGAAPAPEDPHASAQSGDMALGAGFYMGTSTSATQVEGGGIDNDIARWASTHAGWAQPNPGLDHWNRLEEDYAHLEQNGHNAHGFTVDWARIEPQPGQYARAALDHYKQEIAICRKHGMEPMVTLLQYGLPPWLAAKGGVLAPDATQRFAAFAHVCAEEFGDQVTWWATMNEPNTLAAAAYLAGLWPPGKKNPLSMMHALDAQVRMHAAAATELHKVARARGRDAKVGIVFIDDKEYPAQTWNPIDQAAAKLYDYVGNRWFLDALADGKAHRPVGKGEEVPGLKGSIDYLGLNFYGREFGHFNPFASNGPLVGKPDPDHPGKQPVMDAAGLYERILADYTQLRVPILITENGVNIPEPDADNQRGRAIIDALAAIKHARDDGVPVLGYLHWTDWDSPEWHDGWTQHYGLFGFDPQTGRRWDKPAAATFEVLARRLAIPQAWLTADNRQSPALRDRHAKAALQAFHDSR